MEKFVAGVHGPFRTICFDSKEEIQSVFEEMKSVASSLFDMEQEHPTPRSNLL